MKIIKKLENFRNKLRIKKLIREGHDYYTITVNGIITDYVFTRRMV